MRITNDLTDQSNRSALNYARVLSVLALHFDDSFLLYYSFSMYYFVLLSFLSSSSTAGGFSAAATRLSSSAFLFSLARTVFSTS